MGMKPFAVILVCVFVNEICSSRIRTRLQQADQIICKTLQEPKKGDGEKLLKEIELFNNNLKEVMDHVAHPDCPEKRIILRGEKFLARTPKFLAMNIDEMKLKGILGWTDRDLKDMYQLRSETERLRNDLYKTCRRNYKYFFDQDWSVPS